jgi:hypothetical protein
MTQPTPSDLDPAANSSSGSSSKAKAPAVKVLDVVEYTHHDLITGHEVTHVGVVVRADKDDQTVAVRPLAHHYLEVDPANVTPLAAADVS